MMCRDMRRAGCVIVVLLAAAALLGCQPRFIAFSAQTSECDATALKAELASACVEACRVQRQ